MCCLSNILVAFVALLQINFLVLEMFLWQKPSTLKRLGMTADFATQSATLAKNQGLYNGFLAVGLFWGLFEPNPVVALKVQYFFLACVFVAGIYGGLTANKKILKVQALPAAAALLALAFC